MSCVSPPKRRTRFNLRGFLPLADAVSIVVGALLAAWAMERSAFGGGADAELWVATAAIPLWVGAMTVAGGYRVAFFNAGSDVLRRFLAGTTIGVFGLTFVAFVSDLPISRLFVGILAGSAFILGAVARLAFRAFLLRAYRSDRLIERTLIVGHDDYTRSLARLLLETSGIPYRAVGLLWTGDRTALADDGLGIPVVDDPQDVRGACERFGADVVLVVSGALEPTEVSELHARLDGAPQHIIMAPALFPLLPWRMTVETITGLPLVHVGEVYLSGIRAAAKRTIDLVGATVLLAVLGPVALVALVAVLVTDGRPALFRQKRIGRNGRPFTLWKIRTMVPDAERQLEGLREHNQAGGHFFKLADDPRITPLGRVLRAWSIDEIPQLVNVLRGDMSLVGPRPLFSEPESYTLVERRRLGVRPGITGLWQVTGRSTLDGAVAIQKDLFYIDNWTLMGDLVILGRTVSAVLRRKGAK